MKKIYLITLLCLSSLAFKAATFTISTVGTSYSPATLTVSVGDVVTIQASGSHPLVEVSQSTWNANGATPLGGGFGTKTSNYTFTVTSTNAIYYVCSVHVGMGMKGMITVSAAGVNENTISLNNVSLFPNPAKNNMSVNFTANTSTSVSIKLYDVTGREIEKLMNEVNVAQGVHTFNFELPSYLNAGNYFVEVTSGNQKATKKLIITQ